MKLKIYRIGNAELDITPAPTDRYWMDNTPSGFAKRCLPLRIANQAGWVVRSMDSFDAYWSGDGSREGVRFIMRGPPPQGRPFSAMSHFGSGVLTFTIPAVLRTEPGWQLLVMGPPNVPYLGITPLAGVVATDWASHSFTMNWKFTEPQRVVHFNRGDPICQLVPVRLADIEATEPEMLDINDDPELARQHQIFSDGRAQFNHDLEIPGSEAALQKWQKDYFHGRHPDGQRTDVQHWQKLKVCPLTGAGGLGGAG